MKKGMYGFATLSIILLLSACGENKQSSVETQADDNTLEETTEEVMAEETAVEETAAEETTEVSIESTTEESSSDGSATDENMEESSAEDMVPTGGIASEQNGDGVFNLPSAEIKEEYDNLYQKAFEGIYSNYNEIIQLNPQNKGMEHMEWINLGGHAQEGYQIISVGSAFIQVYKWDIRNIGYTYLDLDGDGIYELLIGVIEGNSENTETQLASNEGQIWYGYTLINDQPVPFLKTESSRDRYWLGADGCIYNNGSSGAAYSSATRSCFDSGLISAESEDGYDGLEVVEAIECNTDEDLYVHTYGEIEYNTYEGEYQEEDLISREEYFQIEDDWDALAATIRCFSAYDYFEENGYMN